jgi:DNA-binding HxlR family transcriptional regulator
MPRSGPYTCGIDAAVDLIGGKWKALILWQLDQGLRRPGELRRRLPGISEKMLIQQLRALEADGIVHREVHHEVPPRVEYTLTPFGQSLNDALLPSATGVTNTWTRSPPRASTRTSFRSLWGWSASPEGRAAPVRASWRLHGG